MELSQHYRHVFPAQLIWDIFSWHFKGRQYEWALSLQITKDDNSTQDIMVRHLNFQNFEEFRDKLHRHAPQILKVEIGPAKEIFETDPPSRHFVIDLDYPDIPHPFYQREKNEKPSLDRISNAQLLISLAMIKWRLVRQYKFNVDSILNVFSGKKGYHTWVFGKRVLKFSQEDRKKIVNDFRFTKSINLKKELPWWLHDKNTLVEYTHLAIHCLCYLWEVAECYEDADRWMRWKAMMISCKFNYQYIRMLENSLPHAPGNSLYPQPPTTSYQCLFNFLHNRFYDGMTFGGKNLLESYHLPIIRLFHYWGQPGIDGGVTIIDNHLCKLPACLHPSTGMFAVPFSLDVNNIQKYDIFVPEINEYVSNEYLSVLETVKKFLKSEE